MKADQPVAAARRIGRPIEAARGAGAEGSAGVMRERDVIVGVGKGDEAFAVAAEEGDGAGLAESDAAIDVEEIRGIERGRDDAVEAAVRLVDAARDGDREAAVEPGDEGHADIGPGRPSVTMDGKVL